MGDDLRVDTGDQRVDLDALVRPVRQLGRELHEVAVQRAGHDPVAVGGGVWGDVAQQQADDVAAGAAEAAGKNLKANQHARVVLHDLGLARVDPQIAGEAVADVLDQHAKFEGLIRQHGLGHVIVQLQVGLRMHGDLDGVGLDFLQPAVHVVTHDRLDEIDGAIEARSGQAVAGYQRPVPGHRGVAAQAGAAVHGRDARQLRRDDVEAVSDVHACGIGDARDDRQPHQRAVHAVGQFQPAVETLTLQRGRLFDLELDQFSGRSGAVVVWQVGQLLEFLFAAAAIFGQLQLAFLAAFHANGDGAVRGRHERHLAGQDALLALWPERLGVKLHVGGADQEVRAAGA